MLNWLKKIRLEKNKLFQPKPDFPKKTVIYDCEIVRCIPNKQPSPDLDYCQGWGDFSGMGLSVICAYSSWQDRYHIYLKDNLTEFQTLINQAEEIIGFNSIAFDDQLCAANGLNVKTTYDLLCHVRVAAGMPPNYVKGKTRAGYSLEQLARVNLGYGKSGKGELAPELWQRGKRGQVIDYCMGDVSILKKLYQQRSRLIDPTNGQLLTVD
jgi:DEAD/DEAH box helicase domain-containing protein